ncbi:MAG: hypothetical protein ACI3W5_10605 [Faecousia sp.]
MNAKEAYTLLETLMDGVNPITGELLPEDHVCHEPAVLRALHKALVALQAYESDTQISLSEKEQAAQKPERKKPAGCERAGEAWSSEEEAQLGDLWKNGATRNEIAKLLHRSSWAIQRRLERLGLLDRGNDEDSPPLLLLPWSLEDVQMLKRLHASGSTAEEIAAQMRRPVESIRARMFYMGLTKEAPISLHS